ncbi:Zinc finger protein 112-like protein, partial [Stegodyphus mimosarum]
MKKNTVFSCKQCGQDFAVKKLLHNHEKNCIAPNFNCDICNKQFLDHVLLAKHILTHIGAMPYFCHVCKISFISRRQLQLHSLTHEKSLRREGVNLKLLNGNLHECNRCICKFSSWPKLAFHYVCHIKEMHYTCGICNTSFFNKRNFEIHSHLHKADGVMNCDICNETFEIKSRCLLHVITHSKFEWFRYFPSCESVESAVTFNSSVSSGNNSENLLSVSADNSVNESANCQNSEEVNRIILDEYDNTRSQVFMKEEHDPVTSEYSNELHLESSNRNESHVTLENLNKLGLDNNSQNLKTEPYEITDFDEDSMNEGFSSIDSDNITCKLEHSEPRVKELSVLLYKLPDCVYDAYSYNEYIEVHKLKLVKSRNCWTSSTISNEACGLVDNFPHVCSETIHALSASELEENMCHEVDEESNSYQNFNLKECRIVLIDIAANNVSNSVYTSLPLEESSECVNQALNKVFKNDEVKTRRASSVQHHATKNLDTSDQREALSFYIKSCGKDLVNDHLKSKPLQRENSADNLLPRDQFNPNSCLNGTSENNISVQMKKLYVKVHKLAGNILNLYMNNQPIVLKKDAVLGNLNILGDCSSIVEYNSVSDASNIENGYCESDNFNNEKACCKSNMPTVVENNTTYEHDHRQEDRPNKILSEQQLKGCKKKGNENTVSSTSNFRNEGKSKKFSRKQEQKKIRKKKRLRKKRILFKKYIKSLLLNSCMDSKFLLTLKYSHLARTVKELEKRCKENDIDENYFSFVEGMINSAFLSKKKIKKLKSSSGSIQNYKMCASKMRKNACTDNAAMESISSEVATADNNTSSMLKNNSELNDHNYHSVIEEMMQMKACPSGYLDNKVTKKEKKKEFKNAAEISNKREKIPVMKSASSCSHDSKIMALYSKLEKFKKSQKMKKKKRNYDFTGIASKIIKNKNRKEIDSSTNTNSKTIENVSNGEFTNHASDDEFLPCDVITSCTNHHQFSNEADKNGIQGKYCMRHNLENNKRMKNQETNSFSNFDSKSRQNICENEVRKVSFTKNAVCAKLTERNIVNNIAKASLKRSKYRIKAKKKNISEMKVFNDTNAEKKITSDPKKVSRAVQVTEKRKNNSLGLQNIHFYCSSGGNNKSKHNVFQIKKVNYSGIRNKKKKRLLSENKNQLLMNKCKKKLLREKSDQQLSSMPIINSVSHSDHVTFVTGKSLINSPSKSECERTQNSDNNQEMKSIYLPRIITNSCFSVAQPDQSSYPGISSIQTLHSPSQSMNLGVITPAPVINQNCSEIPSPVLLKYNAVQSLPAVNVINSPPKTNDGNLAYIENCSTFVPALSLVENPLYSQNTDTCSSVEEGKILIQNTNVQGLPVIESVGHLVILNGANISSVVPSICNDY